MRATLIEIGYKAHKDLFLVNSVAVFQCLADAVYCGGQVNLYSFEQISDNPSRTPLRIWRLALTIPA